MHTKALFEALKKEKHPALTTGSATKGKPISFTLLFDDKGAYVQVLDNKGEPVEADYVYYTGPVRTTVKSIQQIQEKTDFVINWDNPGAKVYLHEHPHLIEQLLQTKLWFGEKGDEITVAPGTAQIQLLLEETADKKKITGQTLLALENGEIADFKLVTESYAYSNGLLYDVAPLGSNYNALSLFNTTIVLEDLPKLLSLFFSFIQNVSLRYGPFATVFSDEGIVTKTVLIFEKIDATEALHMRVSQVLPGIEAGFLDDYDLQYYALVNELERLVEVRPLLQTPLHEAKDEIGKMLQKHIPRQGKKKMAEIAEYEDSFIIPKEVAAAFIYKELPGLLGQYSILGAEKLKSYKIVPLKPRLELKLSHGIDFLEGEASLHFENEKFSLFDALQQYNKNKYILLSDGTHAIVNESYMQKLQRLFKKKKENAQVSFFDLPLVEELIQEKIVAGLQGKARDFFEGFNGLYTLPVKLPSIKAKLRPYQQQGFMWLHYLHRHSLGGCLADDMGLGKTLQAICLLAAIYPKQKMPSLIVLPKSLLFNWEKELQKFAPQLNFYVYYGTQRNLEEAVQNQLVITTYSMMRNDIEKLKEQPFYYVVLDESQNIKNMQAQVSKAVMLLDGKHRLALSGTPIENNLGELYSLFRFLNPTMFGTFDNFSAYYLTPIQKHNDKDTTAELRKKIYPFILRRLKKDVLKELPDKIEQVLYVEMSDEQQRFYEQRRRFYKEAIDAQIAQKGIQQSQFFVFQALNELRQIASIPEAQTSNKIASPKIELLIEQLTDAIANSHKALVFVNYLTALELIGEKLEEQGIEYVTMSGNTKNRQQLVDKFQNSNSCKVFLLTLKTGGTGLNLTAADMVFIFDPWWNKAAENQAIDRTHRIGQDKTVLSYKLISKGSIEEKILQLQEKKAEIFNNIISADSASLKAVTEDDIRFILGGD